MAYFLGFDDDECVAISEASLGQDFHNALCVVTSWRDKYARCILKEKLAWALDKIGQSSLMTELGKNLTVHLLQMIIPLGLLPIIKSIVVVL